jgi:hypothetical protein
MLVCVTLQCLFSILLHLKIFFYFLLASTIDMLNFTEFLKVFAANFFQM